jgi:hypothetical protein
MTEPKTITVTAKEGYVERICGHLDAILRNNGIQGTGAELNQMSKELGAVIRTELEPPAPKVAPPAPPTPALSGTPRPIVFK